MHVLPCLCERRTQEQMPELRRGICEPPASSSGQTCQVSGVNGARVQASRVRECCLTSHWNGPGSIGGRVFPRHNHRSRPFNTIVSHQWKRRSNQPSRVRNAVPRRGRPCQLMRACSSTSASSAASSCALIVEIVASSVHSAVSNVRRFSSSAAVAASASSGAPTSEAIDG
jgi:hypothetical protein